jgi:hypothetical protein
MDVTGDHHAEQEKQAQKVKYQITNVLAHLWNISLK